MMRKLPQSQKSALPIPLGNLLRNYFSRLLQSYTRFKRKRLRKVSAHQSTHPFQEILLSYLGSFLGIAILAYLTSRSGYPIIAAPFGATAVLVFAVPNSPLAQPRNVIGGNLIAAIVCVTLVHWFGSEPWVMALAVATAIKLMQLTKTLHPPGGAIALLGVMSHASWDFIWTPILLGSILMVLCTVIYNNLVPGRTYPQSWL